MLLRPKCTAETTNIQIYPIGYNSYRKSKINKIFNLPPLSVDTPIKNKKDSRLEEGLLPVGDRVIEGDLAVGDLT